MRVLLTLFLMSLGCGGDKDEAAPLAADTGSGMSDVTTTPVTTPPTALDVMLTGTGYDDHIGSTVEVALVHLGADAVVATLSGMVEEDGTFSVTFSAVAIPSTTYVLEWYVDADGSGTCEAPPTDLGWRAMMPLEDGHASIEHAYDAETVRDSCWAFGAERFRLSVYGEGYGSYSGKTIVMWGLESGVESPLWIEEFVMDAGGIVDVDFGHVLLRDKRYSVAYYVDENANGECDIGPPMETGWTLATELVTEDWRFERDFDNFFSDALCYLFQAGG